LENIVNNFIIGITSGIVTALIVFFAKSIWIKNLIPWFERLVYKDIYINGKWKSNLGDDEYDGELVEIEQSAHKVNGYIRVSSKEEYTETYQFEGIFKNSILTATFSVFDKSNLDSGSMTMILKENGNKLIGHTAFYDEDEEKIVSKKYIWTRII